MSKYGYRDITDVTLIDLSTGKPAAFLDYLQTTSQTFGREYVYAKGGRGAPKLVGFQAETALQMELTSALFTPELLGIMFGQTVIVGAQSVPITQKVTATANTFVLSATPVVDATHTITVAYAPDGSNPQAHLTKVVSSTPATTEFSLTGATVTVNSTTYASGGIFIVTYYKTSTASNKRVSYATDKFSKAYLVTGYTLWKNTEDEKQYPCRITIPKLQIEIDGSSLASAMNGDPTALTLKGQALRPTASNDLVIYDVDEGDGF